MRRLSLSAFIVLSLSLVFLVSCHAAGWEDEVEGPPDLTGHMQPLGSHRPMEGDIERLDRIPDPVTFYEEYVERSRPVILSRAIANTWILDTWTDQYLSENFGNEEVTAESRKKENRNAVPLTMTFDQFLQRYERENIYMVNEIPNEMKAEVFFPGSISCGGFLEYIFQFLMWFSSGGTKSVLHTDTAHNMHCLVAGEKRFVMIPPEFAKTIGPEWERQGYYNLDVEAVNMTAYPNMVDVPWYRAVLQPGDCMYLPYHWIHQVNSVDRNIGVNLWWAPFDVSMEGCKDGQEFDRLVSLDGIELKSYLSMKLMFLDVMTEDKKIYAEKVFDRLQKNPEMGSLFNKEAVDRMFDLVRPNSGGVLEEKEVLSLSQEKAEQIMELLQNIETEAFSNNLYGDVEGGGFPPDQGGWEGEEGSYPSPNEHQHFEL